LVDREVFDRRLARLEDLLRRLRDLSQIDRKEFLREEGLQAQAERWTQLAAECTLDLANHVIADRGWKTPTTNREAFQVLASEGVLDDELASAMAGWAGLRNILVHLYLEVDHERLYEILRQDLDQLEAFARKLTDVPD
jgi:uncharacterized protein YutE (UPF0331/DUF86 family)